VTGPVVVCIGNLFRRDDGVAAAVAEQLRTTLPARVRLVEQDGEPARLVDAWAGAELAVLVDAVRSGAVPGTVRRIEVASDGLVPPRRPTSTHGYSVGDALQLGRALDRMPVRLVVHAIEGADFGDGPGLSDAVAAAVPDVVAAVLADLDQGEGTH
jgi:hydrogenase maturation protease